MPLDPNISLQVQPVTNPLTQYANVLGVQSAMQKNALLPLQLQQMQLQNQRAQQQFDMISPILTRVASGQSGGSQQPVSDPNNSALNIQDSNGNPVQSASPQGSPQGQQGNGNQQGVPTDDGIPYTLQELGMLALAGHPGAAEALKVKQAAMQGVKFDPGSTYNIGGKVFTVPQLDKGMQIGPNGVVGAIPGYSETNAGIQGAQTQAQEDAKLLPLGYVSPDGRPIGGTVGGYLGAPAPGQSHASGPQGASPGDLIIQRSNQAIKDISGFASPQDAITSLQAHVKNGDVDPQQAQMILNTMPQDPAQFPQWQLGMVRNIMAARDKQIQAGPGAPQQGSAPQAAPGQPPQLQSASEAAQNAADVTARNAPNLAYATDAAKGLQAKAEAIGGQLNESQGLLQRIDQSRQALTQFKAGGGADTRVELAKYAQAFHMPDAVVNGIAGGNLAAAQEFQKYAAQEALGTMQQALASDTGKGAQGNRISMQLFIKNNPNIDTDPNAIEKIYNFQTKLHNELLNKSDMLTKFISDPTTVKDPAVFDNLYAHSQINSGNVNPQMTRGQALGTAPQQQQQAPASGGTMRVSNAADYSKVPSGGTYMAPDGTIRRKP